MISREISVRAEDGGPGYTPGETSSIATMEAKIEAVGEEIRAVKSALSEEPHYLGRLTATSSVRR